MTPAGRVDDGTQPGVGQDAGRVAQVRRDDGHAAAGGEQRPGVGQHDGVGVGVGRGGGRVDRLRDLVGVLPGRQSGAQVEELADALLGCPGDGAGEEGPVLACHGGQRG